MKVYVDCVGCEQRQLDAQRVIDYFTANKIDVVDSPSDCDFIICVTCAVDQTQEQRSINRLTELLSGTCQKTPLVVGGCLPSISPTLLSAIPLHATFTPRNLDVLDEIFSGNITLPMKGIPAPYRTIFDHLPNNPIDARGEYESAKSGFKICINQGCLLHCSYCAIRNATGILKSEPLDDIMRLVNIAVFKDEPTVMLMGGDTGAYGRDIGLKLHDLIRALLDSPGNFQLFVHDLNINWLIKDISFYLKIAELDSISSKRIRGICLPIQSGSDRILRFMRRPYSSSDVIKTIKRLRLVSKHTLLGTHIIVGFPGETDEDFQNTIRLLTITEFDFISCFPYSERTSARSVVFPDKVPDIKLRERLYQIQDACGDKVKIYGLE